jgi:hypothetical protein
MKVIRASAIISGEYRPIMPNFSRLSLALVKGIFLIEITP